LTKRKGEGEKRGEGKSGKVSLSNGEKIRPGEKWKGKKQNQNSLSSLSSNRNWINWGNWGVNRVKKTGLPGGI
jgi:hypothetical protein